MATGFSKTIEDEHKHEKEQQPQQQRPIYEVTRGIRSPQTQVVYQRALNRFLDHIQIHDLQGLLDFSPKVIKQMIIDYVIFLRDDKRLIAGTIKVHLAAVLHFFQINKEDDFNLTIRSFRFHLPSDDSVNDDRPYTAEEIAQVLQVCDIRSKVVILLLCSSGMRIGALPGLQIGHLTPVKWHEEYDLYKVQVYAGTRDKYYTFTTPETTKAVNDYLEFRRRCGEQLKDKPKSPLIGEQFNRDNPFTINSPKFVTKKAIEYLIDKILRTADMRKIKEVHMSHGMRKFFVSQCEGSPMKSVHVSMLAGHDTGIKKTYYIPKDSVVLEDFMTHAADALTIDPNQRLQKKIQELETEQAQEIAQLKSRYTKLETEYKDVVLTLAQVKTDLDKLDLREEEHKKELLKRREEARRIKTALEDPDSEHRADFIRQELLSNPPKNPPPWMTDTLQRLRQEKE